MMEDEPPGAELFLFDPEELEQIVTAEVGGSALFASRFRECAARALLLPRRDPGRRSPLWQQRQRSAALLEVASKYPSFPIVLEAVRECLQDVYDLPALVSLMKAVDRREVQVVDVATHSPSPYARTLLFGYVAQFVYEGDSPIAERRAAALSLDQGLLAELLGRAELRELLDPAVLAEVEAELQRLTPERRARDAEGVVDLLRLLGPLTLDEVQERCNEGVDAAEALAALGRRVVAVRVAGRDSWAVVEDISRLRDGLGVAVPPGTPEAFTDPVDDPLADLVSRYARTHGPFTTDQAAARLGLGGAVVRHTLQRLAAQGRVLDGEFRPSGSGSEWCDADVLRSLRRRSLARLRKEVEPVPAAALGRFLPAWQHVVSTSSTTGAMRGPRGVDGVLTVIDQLAGAPVPASALESLVLPARVRDYEPSYLDELTAAGEVLWAGHGSLPGADGWVSLHLADQAALTLPEHAPFEHSELHQRVLEALEPGGAWFFRQLADSVGSTDDRALSAALWDLVWAGRISNDTLTPLRALTRGGRATHRTKGPPPRLRMSSTTGRRGGLPARTGPPETAGRWALLPTLDTDPTRRAHATAERLLDRHGVVIRGAVASESGHRAGSRRRTRCSRRSRTPAAAGAATSSTAWAPHSSAPRVRSTGCAPSPRSTRTTSPPPSAWRPPTRPTRTAQPWPGRSRRARPPGPAGTGRAARPARWSSWSTASSPSTSSGAARRCSPGPRRPTGSVPRPRRWPRPPGAARSAG